MKQVVLDELVKKSFWGVMGGLLALGTLLWGLRNHFSPLELAMMGVLVVVVAALAWWTLYRLYSYRSYYYPRVGHHFEVDVQEVRYIVGLQGLKFTKCWKIRAKQDMLDEMVDRFIWTGDQKSEVLPKAGKGVASIQERFQAGIWTFYTVMLGRSLRKGEPWELDYSWPVLTNPEHASPFVSMSTEQPTKTVKFVIQLGPTAAGRPVLVEELRAIESIHPLSTTPKEFDSDGRFEHEIPAKLYRHYRVRWSWGPGEVPEMPTEAEVAGEAN